MLIRWLLNAVALLVVAWVVPGWLHLSGVLAALIAALLLGLVNAFIRPVLLVLTLPINAATLGLFTFVLNAILLTFVAWLVPGVSTGGFLPAIGASILISIVSSLLSSLVKKK